MINLHERMLPTSSTQTNIHETRGPNGPEITHLDKADHDMLHCAMMAIRLPLAIQNLMFFEEFQDCHHGYHLGYWN